MWSGAEYEHNCFDGTTLCIKKPTSASQKEEKLNPCRDGNMNHKHNHICMHLRFKTVQYHYPLNAVHWIWIQAKILLWAFKFKNNAFKKNTTIKLDEQAD